MLNKTTKLVISMVVLLAIIVTANPFEDNYYLSGSEEQPEENPIGFETLDEGEVLHIWNTNDDYYFNITSGIQFTNHYQEYWTKNVFCIGYYSGTEWIKIKCADELGEFNRNIKTDNETYVNATLWKDFSYSGYDMRLGIRYHLKTNDTKLSIIIYGKNIGSSDINVDLGFAWKIQDIDVPFDIGEDRIFINNTEFSLDENLNLLFKNMTKFDNVTNQTVDIPFFRIIDDRYLRLDWNENLNYAIKMYGDGNQNNFYVTLLINAGIFSSGQEKSTIIYWIDASFPQVADTATSQNTLATTNHIVSLPATVNAGETLLVFISSDSNEDFTFPGGWTALHDTLGNGCTLGVAWKKAAGTEGGTTITVTTGTTEESAHISWSINGAADPTVSAPEASTGAWGSSTTPNPDSLTVGGGSDSYLWIATVSTNEDVGTNSYSVGYNDNQATHDGGTGAGGTTIIVCSKEAEAETDDPGTMEIDEEVGWGAATIAVYPAVAPPDTSAPTYTYNITNTTTPNNNDWVKIHINWTDETELNFTWCGNNFTGDWINETPVARVGLTSVNHTNVTQWTVGDVKIGCYYCYANDNSSNFNTTLLSCITSTDTTPPFWSNNQTNTSTIYPNRDGQFNITIGDNIGLSSYKFQWNDTGAWINISNVTISGTSHKISENHTVTSSTGTTISYRFCGNDTSDNWNCSLTREFDVTTAPPITISNINCTSNPSGDTTETYNSTGDLTPSFEFNTDVNTNCDISDSNTTHWTDCGTTGTTTHICTLPFNYVLRIQTDYIYINCTNVLEDSIYDEWQVYIAELPFVVDGTIIIKDDDTVVIKEC